ncbi:alpha-xylosidase [Paenibacillus turpanensis]|uniref:alpha-xylosidase n=1 Tax=Paenibacillus turpanensis TaxID=2689078 RepID=UPI001409CFDE|nr:alpha-xylosidase [Paenibacillus turpanensis]
MKFTDGNWLVRQGYEFISSVQPFDVHIEEGSIIGYASPRDLTQRWAQLDLPLLTVRLSSPRKDIIRVQLYRHKGGRRKLPEFMLHSSGDHDVRTERLEREALLTSGSLTARVRTEGAWGINFEYDGQKLTGTGTKAMAHISTPNQGVFMREQLDLAVGEQIYGLGERFTPFVKNGQVVDTWNRDGGTSTEQAYKNIPFYLSSRGYGVFVNHPENVSFEVASERVSKVQFSVEGEQLDYFIIGGSSLKEVLQNYTSLSGKPALPPSWSFGLWLTTSFTTNYDEQTVNHFVDGMKDRDIPLRVFHFDCFWMKALHWTDFEWDDEVFPDPEPMLRRLKEKDLAVCVWINPYIAQQSCLFDEAVEKGYLLRKTNGDVWQWDRWQPGMGIVDFTNPNACKWYTSHLERLIDMGVDSFKTDFGERIPTDVVYYDGSDPDRMHNYYSYLYNKVVFELLEARLGKGKAAVFARSATAGGQQFPVHWGGDCYATYESMAESLRGGLSLGLSGFGFWSHDIGGFESTAPADLYKRWTAFGLLSSHSRLHGNQSYRVPWIYDEEAVDVMRFFVKLKCRIMPYLFAAACEASEKGIPMMRAMLLEFADDPTCGYLDRQYMLGESLLVAPIFREDGVVQYYLPKGTWTHFITGKEVEGGTWVKEQHGYMSLPLYVRPNSIIAVGAVDSRPDYDYAHRVELQLYRLEDGGKADCCVYDENGENQLSICASREGNQLTVDVSLDRSGQPWTMLLRNCSGIRSVDGAAFEKTVHGIRLAPNPGVTAIVCVLA